jgi:hypothetical protein
MSGAYFGQPSDRAITLRNLVGIGSIADIKRQQ